MLDIGYITNSRAFFVRSRTRGDVSACAFGLFFILFSAIIGISITAIFSHDNDRLVQHACRPKIIVARTNTAMGILPVEYVAALLQASTCER